MSRTRHHRDRISLRRWFRKYEAADGKAARVQSAQVLADVRAGVREYHDVPDGDYTTQQSAILAVWDMRNQRHRGRRMVAKHRNFDRWKLVILSRVHDEDFTGTS